MSDNPLIEGFLKLHEAGGIGGGMSGTKFSNAASYAPAVRAGVLGAVDNITMGAVTNPEAQNNYPVAYNTGSNLATAAQVATGVGAAKALGAAVIKAGLKSATAKNTVNTIAKNADADDFQLGSKNTLDLTPPMRVPRPTLKLTQQMRTEEENDSSKGNTEMSTNPYIKGFFDIEEARAKNTNIFDESKKLTAAQKKNLDKNDNDKIDAEDFEMLRKEEVERDELGYGEYGDKREIVISPKNHQGKIIRSTGLHTVKKQPYKKEVDFDEAESYTHQVGGYYTHRGDDKPVSVKVRAKSKEEAQRIASEQLSASHKNFRPTIVKQLTNEGLDEAKKTNSMVMARNISKVLKAAKPDFLDIDKDGDKEESMKKAAADKKIDEAVTDEHRERALATINARISKPGQPPKHPTYDGAPADIKTAVDNLAKMYAESVDLDEANILPSNFSDRTTPVPNKKAYAIDKANSEKKKPVSLKKAPFDMKEEEVDLDEGIKEKIGGMIRREKEKEYPLLQNRRDVAAGKAAKSYAAGDEKKGDRYMKWRSDNMKKEEVEFSEEEIDFINNVMEAMPVAPTSENDSPNPTPKKKAEGSRAKGSMAD
jgi:hypothetical protein